MDSFVHIPKSSGSTMRAVLSRQYGIDRILYFEPGWKTLEQGTYDLLINQIARRGIELVTGHYPFGIHSIIKTPCRYFAVMRDPIERAISDFYYAYSYPHHRFRDEIISGKISLEEFMTNSRYAPGDAQASMLAGNCCSLHSRTEAAIENVRNSFAAVGSTERFSETILLIAKALGWKPPLYANKNVTKLDDATKANRKKATAEARSRYEQFFRMDYMVYGAVDALLTKRIEEEGSAFQRALEGFREIEADIARRVTDQVFERYEFHQNDQLPHFAVQFEGSDPYRAIENYLRTPIAGAALPKNYVGNVDVIEGHAIQGWAGDLAREEPIEITVWRSGERLISKQCNVPRKDLQQAGFLSGCLGFKIGLDEPIVNRDDYAVCYEQTSILIPMPPVCKIQS